MKKESIHEQLRLPRLPLWWSFGLGFRVGGCLIFCHLLGCCRGPLDWPPVNHHYKNEYTAALFLRDASLDLANMRVRQWPSIYIYTCWTSTFHHKNIENKNCRTRMIDDFNPQRIWSTKTPPGKGRSCPSYGTDPARTMRTPTISRDKNQKN